MNKVILSGRLTREIDLRQTQSGKAWISTGIAVNRMTKGKEVDFFNLVAWDKTAEIMAKYLGKGSKIMLEGRLQFNQYEAKDGTKKNNVNVIVDSFEFMEAKGQRNNDSAPDVPDEEDFPF